MAGVDRYGRPMAQAANPYHDQPQNNPAAQPQPQPQPQNQNANQGAQAPQPNAPQNTGYNGANAAPPPQAQPQQTREQWRDNWMSQGQMSSQQMDDWMAKNGATKQGANGTFTTPYGDTLDLGIGYKTGTVTPGWTALGGGGPDSRGGYGMMQSGAAQGGMTPAMSASQFALSQGYKPQTFSQFQAPDQSQIGGMQQGLMQQMLQHPESMSPQVVEQMKRQGMEASQAQFGGLKDQLMQQQAARGMGMGGSMDAGLRRLGESQISGNIANNRAIDIGAAQTNFGDRLNTLGASNDFLGQQLGRAQSGYQTGLMGQQAQAEENARAYGLNEGTRQFDANLGLQQQQMGNQNSQYYAGLNQNQNQFNSNMDLNWGQFGQQKQNDLLKFLFPNGLTG